MALVEVKKTGVLKRGLVVGVPDRCLSCIFSLEMREGKQLRVLVGLFVVRLLNRILQCIFHLGEQ